MKVKIIVPVDFTAVSEKAIEFVAKLAQTAEVHAHFVHVIQVNEAEWGGSNESSDSIDHAAIKVKEQNATNYFNQLKQQLSFAFSSRILYGGLTTALLNYAAGIVPDLIIMGNSGADGLLEKISGSEAQQIVRHTEIPVISIHVNASVTPIKNILWVADFKEDQQQNAAIRTIKNLQTLFGADLHLLQIMQPTDEDKKVEIEAQMQNFARKLELDRYELHLQRDYKVPQGVRNFNMASEMDLVIIGTHARNGISQLFYGSVAETLVNRCIRPLLTYHLKK